MCIRDRHITEPFGTEILEMKYRKATTEIRNKADYLSYEDKLTDNEKNICNEDVYKRQALDKKFEEVFYF